MSERSARILDAADELFAARGLSGVSIRDIAERAGVNKGLVFYYFDSKTSLFERVLDRYYAAHARALEPDHAGRSPRDRVHGLVDSYIDFIEDHHRYVQLVQRELTSGSEVLPYVQRGLRALHERVAEVFGDLVPGSRALDVKQFFVSFSGLVNTYYIYAPVLGELWGDDPMSAGSRRTRREHLHWIVDALLDKLES